MPSAPLPAALVASAHGVPGQFDGAALAPRGGAHGDEGGGCAAGDDGGRGLQQVGARGAGATMIYLYLYIPISMHIYICINEYIDK